MGSGTYEIYTRELWDAADGQSHRNQGPGEILGERDQRKICPGREDEVYRENEQFRRR